MTTIEWRKRRSRRLGDTAEYWITQSVCGRYRVVEANSLYGLPRVYRAMQREEITTPRGPRTSWSIISTHRKPGPAKAACEAVAACGQTVRAIYKRGCRGRSRALSKA